MERNHYSIFRPIIGACFAFVLTERVRLRFLISGISLFILLLASNHSISQCAFGGINWGNITPIAVGETFALTNVWGGDQYTLDVVSGCEYTVTTCGGSFDTQITIFDETNAWVFYNDDFAACGLQSEITFTAASTGAYTVQINEWSCAINFTDTYFAVTLNSCSGGCNDPTACNYSSTGTDPASCCYDNCIDFEMFDSFGDGWNDAAYSILNELGIVAASGTLAAGGYGLDVLCLPTGCYSVTVGGGSWDSEVSWTITGGLGGPISGVAPSSGVELNLGGCLGGCNDPAACNYILTGTDSASCCYDGCVTIDMFDTFGDGWNGALYQITDENGVPLISGGLLAGAFGSDTFCLAEGCYTISVGGGLWETEITWTLSGIDGGSISGGAPQDASFGINAATGCTDSNAANYDPSAQCDDGSCLDCISDVPTGCPEIELGDDIVIPECFDPCENLTLNADYFETGETTEYEVCAIPYAPPYAFSEGTPILVSQDDVWSEEISLPFDFCFFGNPYDKIVVGANAVITFDLTLASPAGCDGLFFPCSWCEWAFSQSIPNSTGFPYRNSINGPYHDIDPAVGGNIRYAILGSYPCRTFVVNYESVPHFACNDIMSTSQIVLYETTNAIEVYIDEKPTCSSWNDGNAVIGVQNATGTVGFTPESRQTGMWDASNEAWRFTPSGNSIVDISWSTQDDGYIGSGASIEICPDQATESFVAEAVYTVCDGAIVTVSDIVNVSCAQIMLPVEWLEFTAKLENEEKEVYCDWQTASEINNEYFSVERSKDGLDWGVIGEVLAGENPNFAQSYRFIDSDPLIGESYYRIRQNDVNGEFDYSEIRSVERAVTDLSIFPNPGNGTFRILGYSGEGIAIHDMRGRGVECEITETGEITLPNCSAGTYLVKIGYGNAENCKHLRLIVE